ncbi:Hypothetical_protein [Hexamita inflata]|uniref:Hypothetical_protein n=1 Tax=Hexamita inflata TaxID=28002 RepID=A0AA86USN8_9EUKA|nr:Hypothetical protein HINF_LOCUS57825 [Hexamita inflata]CAI9970182.1 Hypothetical protein HINF_LOCUS57827 [Hexamita inflata]
MSMYKKTSFQAFYVIICSMNSKQTLNELNSFQLICKQQQQRLQTVSRVVVNVFQVVFLYFFADFSVLAYVLFDAQQIVNRRDFVKVNYDLVGLQRLRLAVKCVYECQVHFVHRGLEKNLFCFKPVHKNGLLPGDVNLVVDLSKPVSLNRMGRGSNATDFEVVELQQAVVFTECLMLSIELNGEGVFRLRFWRV